MRGLRTLRIRKRDDWTPVHMNWITVSVFHEPLFEDILNHLDSDIVTNSSSSSSSASRVSK